MDLLVGLVRKVINEVKFGSEEEARGSWRPPNGWGNKGTKFFQNFPPRRVSSLRFAPNWFFGFRRKERQQEGMRGAAR
ncbi:hypothetical protein E2562_038893 [Oryza meyeriana var. granulata]|uniref:Uncharacterized protein n=1 Tax=Oryza meyeriana var. granulata TaxID=110450 RepID=A0A6G1EUC0_9ORYZ|nr:hypothetical protein E2562_038893 [Oryza meyeriana var. granulata]